MNDQSHTFRRDGARAAAPPTSAWLFRVLSCDQPLTSAARWPLDGVDEVLFVRGKEREPESSIDRSERRLILRLPDRAVSSSHARLSCALGGWTLEDTRSTNGSFVNESRVERARLADGDRLEIGHSFFLFRAALPAIAAPPRADVAGLMTQAPALGARFAELERIAPSRVPVIVLGESGTGKELMARAVHRLSARKGPFVPVNCGALPTTLVQSELFGYKRGAFSGADEDRPGIVRSADHGTLFLDEIGDLPLASQAALLRVLQEGEVTPLGATRPIAVDVRVVAATHRDLDALVAVGQFRADLLARLGGWTLRLPPLRERLEDLGLLLGKLAPDAPMTLTWQAARALIRYDWPLNVRELQKCVSSALVLSGGAVDVAHLPPAVNAAPRPPAPSEPLSPEDEQRKRELAELMQAESGNIAAVARALGKAPVQIRRWARRYQLDPDQFRR